MTSREARALFARERRAFARTFPRVARARLVVSHRPYTHPRKRRYRDVAYATFDPPTVVLLRRALALPRANVVGLIRHELGHLADAVPWRPGVEQRADDLAEIATGRKIRYDRDLIQTTGTGRYPRPRSLPR